MRVRLTPAGGADRIDGRARDEAGLTLVKARVRAAPENGEANAALEKLLAKALGRPKTSVAVTRGASARIKTVRIEGLEQSELDAFLAALPEVS